MAPHSPAVKLPSRATSASASAEAAMGAHRWSHAIAKATAAPTPPRKIRIVHVLAPEVIKTDARHFRELVQRLTGKPNGCGVSGGAAVAAASSSSESAAVAESSSTTQPTSASSSYAASEEGSVAADGGTVCAAAAAAAAATIKAEVKEDASSREGFVPALAEGEEGINDVFFEGLEDFLFSSYYMECL